ncbi:hypothetical protein AGMMS50222_06990 [Endomicrobiia bacterium]|nr:hypothetical protein AGMMS49556_06460 [Endomicrobiia bacterium]GHT75641.1 hypothetical protein AGMMS50222_06990 [Endomicrobiia bacterium]
MKKVTGLITIILGLIISSCDKKNAGLVNRRTAPHEKIEEIEAKERVRIESEQALAKEEERSREQAAQAEKEQKESLAKQEPTDSVVIQPQHQLPPADGVIAAHDHSISSVPTLAQPASPLTQASDQVKGPSPVPEPDSKPEEYEGLGLEELFDETKGLEEFKEKKKISQKKEEQDRKRILLAEYLARYPDAVDYYAENPIRVQRKADCLYEWEQETKRRGEERAIRYELEKREDEERKRKADEEWENGGAEEYERVLDRNIERRVEKLNEAKFWCEAEEDIETLGSIEIGETKEETRKAEHWRER